jgi:hypothetical protein
MLEQRYTIMAKSRGALQLLGLRAAPLERCSELGGSALRRKSVLSIF